jgi:predicted Ser/Thr protein kinase
MFAVLTRMRKPSADRYPRALTLSLATLTALEKLDLYATGRAPDRFEPDAQKLLASNVKEIFGEGDAYPIYEGRIGASPREMRGVILDAAQSSSYRCLSPLAVLEEIEALCQSKTEFEWLQQDPISGGYHDVKDFRSALMGRLLETWEREFYTASGFIDEARYAELFDRYVQHVSVWVKKERIRNRVTGEYEEPDEKLMREVERLIEVKGDAQEARKQTISAIAAWSIDHPGQRIDAVVVFPHLVKRMREAILGDRKPAVAKLARDIVILEREEGTGLDHERRKDSEAAIVRLEGLGYCRNCAADAASTLLRRRFADLL